MHAIVSRPRRLDRARKRQHLVRQQIVIRRRDGIPLVAVLDGVLHKSVEKHARVGLFRVAADMFQSPCKRKRAPVGFLRPAHVFVPPNCLFKASHCMQTNEYSVAPRLNQIASNYSDGSVSDYAFRRVHKLRLLTASRRLLDSWILTVGRISGLEEKSNAN